MILEKNINRKELYKTYYQILNSVLNLTKTEIEILDKFRELSKDDAHKLGSDERKLISSELKMSIYNLNNYIRTLKDKGMLITVDNKLIINPNLLLEDNKPSYSVKFKINIK